MALAAGTVTVATDGSRTGSGMALAIYDALLASPMTAAALADEDISNDAKIKIKQGDADFAAALASGIVSHIVANAEVTVTIGTGDAGLQTDPSPPKSPTLAPSAPVVLSTKGTIA